MSWWLNMLQAMAGLLLLWSAAFFVMAGWGLLALRARRQSVSDLEGLLRAFWIGLCLVLLALTCWHFVFPVYRYAMALWICGGLLGWSLAGLRPLLRAADNLRSHRTAALLFFLLAVVLSNCLLQQTPFWDTGLYYLQAIKWNQEYPLVAGLGNLHSRLAFNNSSFLLQAVVLQGPWREIAYGLVNGMLALVVTLQSFLCFSRLAKSQTESVACDTLGTLLAVPVFVGLHGTWIRMGPDATSVAMQMAALFYACRFTLVSAHAGEVPSNSPSHASQDSRSTNLFLAVALLAGAVTVKLSAAPFAFLLTLMLGGWSAYLAFGPRPVLARSAVLSAVVVSAATILPWCARGVVLSGYPLFPSSLGSMDVPWAVPAESAKELEATICNWARKREKIGLAPGERWMGQWFKRHSKNPQWMNVPLGLTMLVAVWLVAYRRRIRLRRPEGILLALIALAAAAALAVWFLKAPDPRFGYQLFYILLIVAVTAAVQTSCREMSGADVSRRLGWMFAVFWLCAYLPLRSPATNVGYSQIPVAEVTQTRTLDGTRISIPVAGQRAWAAELPSAPNARNIPFLRLRREGDLSSGFEWMEPPETANTGGQLRR